MINVQTLPILLVKSSLTAFNINKNEREVILPCSKTPRSCTSVLYFKEI
jgi:hypothetical protein